MKNKITAKIIDIFMSILAATIAASVVTGIVYLSGAFVTWTWWSDNYNVQYFVTGVLRAVFGITFVVGFFIALDE